MRRSRRRQEFSFFKLSVICFYRVLGNLHKSQTKICDYKSIWFWLLIFTITYIILILIILPRNEKNISNNKKNRNNNNIPLFSNNNNNDLILGYHPYNESREYDKSLPINSDDVEGELVELTHPWGTVFRHRILCMVLSLWPDRKEKWDLIIDTYGPGCTKLYFVLDEASNGPKEYRGYETLNIKMKREQGKEIHQRNIWEKVHSMWGYIWSSGIVNDYDWFFKADDDTFVVIENMKGFLQYYNPNLKFYLGHTLRARWEGENLIFNSGICYVLSRGALLKIGPYLNKLPSLPANKARSHCIDREGAGEDPTMGICMAGVGIRPGNTLDHYMRERFLIFRPDDHSKIYREDTWYWKYKPKEVQEGENCCSPYIVCAHNYKSLNDAKQWFPILHKKYNTKKDWSKIELPPKPRRFIYDPSSVDFEIDEYLNTKNPPRGQRIYKGPNKEWTCWNCKIGDKNDPYWTDYWDL